MNLRAFSSNITEGGNSGEEKGEEDRIILHRDRNGLRAVMIVISKANAHTIE